MTKMNISVTSRNSGQFCTPKDNSELRTYAPIVSNVLLSLIHALYNYLLSRDRPPRYLQPPVIIDLRLLLFPLH